ncbi:MAG: sodium:proton antiporter [Pseudomonadota bacterium]
MTNALWFLLVGVLLLAMGLTSSVLKRLPITPAIIYLAVGILVGPTGLNVFHFNPLKDAALLEVLTEVVVLISLFSAGVKMPVPFNFTRWRAPIMLATVSMAISVGLVAAFAHYLLGLPLGAGVLLGAILAPTDPVLATDVQSRHPGDRDQLRFTLTSEAGMNDGSAFPFVMLGLGLLGLHELGDYGLHWMWMDVLWATAAAVAIGIVCGAGLAWLGCKLRSAPYRHELMDDFLGLGLIGVVYGLSVLVGAWGFLAVFFAAVALRQTELKLTGVTRDIHLTHASQQAGSTDSTAHPDIEPPPTVSEGSLVFKEHLERLSEVVLILLVGGTLFHNSWSWRVVGLALFLFVVVRPLSVLIGLLASRVKWRMRGMMGWFGVRGIGSLYYLMYAIQHGLPEPLALELIQFTLITVTLSIIVHGISVKPMMNRFQRRQKRAPKA